MEIKSSPVKLDSHNHSANIAVALIDSYEEVQNGPVPNLPLWHKEHFELQAVEQFLEEFLCSTSVKHGISFPYINGVSICKLYSYSPLGRVVYLR